MDVFGRVYLSALHCVYTIRQIFDTVKKKKCILPLDVKSWTLDSLREREVSRLKRNTFLDFHAALPVHATVNSSNFMHGDETKPYGTQWIYHPLQRRHKNPPVMFVSRMLKANKTLHFLRLGHRTETHFLIVSVSNLCKDNCHTGNLSTSLQVICGTFVRRMALCCGAQAWQLSHTESLNSGGTLIN
jgi:hypothetical protein